MSPEYFKELRNFLYHAVGTAIALVAFLLLWLLLNGLRGHSNAPVEPFGMVERILEGTSSSDAAAGRTVNVEFRDSTGALIDLGPLVRATLRNGRGRLFELRDGAFLDCEAAFIKVGTVVQVSIQEGIIREDLRVQLDFDKQVLFVQSKLAVMEVRSRINSQGR